ncbi:MAG: guanylate kinase [archaeon]
MSGKVFVFTGPSGAGKTTLAQVILKEMDSFQRIITYTTRGMREGEKDGIDSNFVSRKKFEQFIKDDKLLEHAIVYGNYYGSLRSDVEKIIASGKNVLFVVDVQGALTIKKKFSSAITIFVKTPSLQELRERLEKRALDSKEIIEKRLTTAEQELVLEGKFDFVVVNDVLLEAVARVKEIISSSLKS